MALRYLLDTDTCIYLAKHTPRSVVARLASEPADAAAISVITYGEMRFGAEQSSQRLLALATLDHFAGMLEVLPLQPSVAVAYGMIRAELKRNGKLIGANDLWIASHAMAMNLTLVTNNLCEFQRVPRLRIENWVN